MTSALATHVSRYPDPLLGRLPKLDRGCGLPGRADGERLVVRDRPAGPVAALVPGESVAGEPRACLGRLGEPVAGGSCTESAGRR